MATSRTQQDTWVYVGVGALISALVLVTVLPLLAGLWQPSNSSSPAIDPSRSLDNQALGYQLVLGREPDNVNALLGLLDIRLQQHDLNAAIAPLERLGQLNPDQVQYRLLLAETKTQLDDLSGAAGVYQSILSQSPYNIQALKGISQLYLQESRATEAVSVVQRAITQAIKAQSREQSRIPLAEVTSLQLLLGEIYLSQNRPEQAIAIYEAASQVNLEDFRPLLAKAEVLAQTGKVKDAVLIFEQAILLAPVQYKDAVKQISLRAMNGELNASQNGASAAPASDILVPTVPKQ